MRYPILVSFVVVLSCAGQERPAPSAGPLPTAAVVESAPVVVAVADTSLGFVKGSVFVAEVAPAARAPSGEAGSTEVRPRAFAGAPPVIPHSVAGMLPVTAGTNECLGCHEGDPNPVPPSHFTDLRRSPDKVGKNVVATRHACTACHVPQWEM